MRKRIAILVCGFLVIWVLSGFYTSFKKYPASAGSLQITPTVVPPDSLEPITYLNANQLEAIQTIGLGQLTRMVWSPDGTRLAVATPSTFWLYAGEALENYPKLIGRRSMVTIDMRFSSDGNQLAVVGTIYENSIPSEIMIIWNLASNQSQEIEVLSDRAPRLAFLDNQVLVGSFSDDDMALYITNAETGSVVTAIPSTNELINFEFSVTGRFVAYSTRDNKVYIFDLVENREVFSVELRATYNQLRFSPDEKLLAIGGLEGGVQIWDWEKHELKYQFAPSSKPVIGLAFSPDGRLLAESRYTEEDLSFRKGIVRFIDVVTGSEINSISFEKPALFDVTHYFMQLMFTSDGQQLIANWNGYGGWGETQMWDALSGEELKLGIILPYHATTGIFVFDSVFTPDSRELLFLSRDGVINRWSIPLAKSPLTLSLNTNFNSITETAFGHRGQILAAGDESGMVYIWDTMTGNLFNTIDYNEPITALSFSQDDSYLVIGTLSGDVFIWNLQAQEEEIHLDAHDNGINTVLFSPDRHWLVTTDGYSLRLWDMQTGLFFAEELSNCCVVAFSSDSNYLAISAESSNFIWEIATRSRVLELPNPASDISALTFNLDGTILAGTASSDPIVYLWDIKTGNVLNKLEQNLLPSDLEFSPDGRLIAVPTNLGTINLYGIAPN